MKQFFKRIGIYGIIVLALSMLLDILISRSLKTADSFAFGESVIWNTIYQGNLNADLVVYGSSRAWVHINPQMIEDSLQIPSYNLGIDGHGFWLQYLRHKEFLTHNDTPKLIVLTVGPFTLSKRKDLYNYEQFLPYVYKGNVKTFTESYEGFSALDYYLPLFRYRGKKEELKLAFKGMFRSENENPYRVKGYRGRNRTWNEDLKNAKEKMKSYNVVIDKESKLLFEAFYEECKTQGIKLVVVYAPEYVEGQDFIANREEVMTIYKQLELKYNVPFLDYSIDDMCYQKDYFYNSMHLNTEGAELFTAKLISDLKAMNLF